MRAKPNSPSTPGSRAVKDIRRANRRHYSAEDKIRIVLDDLQGEDSIAELCRREGIAQSLLLRLVERVSGSWQAPTGWRHSADGNHG